MKSKRCIRSKLYIIALATCMIWTMSGCGADSDVQAEAGSEQMPVEDKVSENTTVEYRESQMEHDKEESVYVLADAYGTPEEITVTARLKNPGEGEPITDFTTLSDIRNKEGDENYTLSGEGILTWENYGKDIQYEGTADRELPVSVRVSYYLNGKKVTAEELAGASGAVKIRFDYMNDTEADGSVVPFTVISGMLLKEENVSKVTVSNGKVKMLDGNYLVIGYAVPGVEEALALDELEVFENKEDETEQDLFTDFIEVSFDTVDFELEFTATLMTNGILAEMDLEEISEQVDDLADGFESLNDGAGELMDALKKLDKSGAALVSGAAEMQSGLESLNATLSQLSPEILMQNPALSQLAATVAALTEGSAQLTAGITAYTNGVGQVCEGSRTLNDATGELTEAADDLQTAMQRIKSLQTADYAYTNYSGIEEGKTGSVIFILETAELQEKEEES